MSEEGKPPEKSGGDVANAIGKALASSVPVVGGALGVLYENVFAPPFAMRQQRFMEYLYERVEQLKENVKDLTDKKLSEDPEFISAVARAAQIALRTHDEDKLKLLMNALQNVVIQDIGQIEAHIFLSAIDELTTLHVRTLYYLSDPIKYQKKVGVYNPNVRIGSPNANLIGTIPIYRNNRLLLDIVQGDLIRRGFASDNNGDTNRSDALVSSSTVLGDRFLDFLRKPFPSDEE